MIVDSYFKIHTVFHFRCIILDNSGFIVMHPRLKDTTDESDFHEPKHITVEVFSK